MRSDTFYVNHSFELNGKKINFRGIESPIEFVRELSSNTWLVKIKGHNAWGGRGLTTYYPTEYLIIEFEVVDERFKRGTRVFRLENIKNSRKEVPLFVEEYEKLTESEKA